MHSWPNPPLPSLPGTGVPLRLHDTADGATNPVTPGETATMYVCGITPYDATHLGHAATYLAFDVINRVLRDNGHDVHFVQNITDVDDPLFERAARDGVDWRELGASQIDLFRSDMEALRVIPPRDYVGVTETVGEVVELVGRLLDMGAAYRIPADVDPEYQDIYFPIDATAQFGYESGYDAATMRAIFVERGGDPERPGKRDPLDALLWRMKRPGEPSWPSPWGEGRPGWHIECAAIAGNRLGVPFDIQGGGCDLVFPHHEFSAAHLEAATGEQRMSRFYVHTGMIGLDGEKMSKSVGNLVFVSKLRESGVDPAAIRLALLSGNYREDRSWTDELGEEATKRLETWRRAAVLATGPSATEFLADLRARLADDLDTPRALAVADAWADEALTDGGDDASAPGLFADAVDALLGVDLRA